MGLENTSDPQLGRVANHIAMCLLGAFLLSLQQAGGKKMPRITRPQVYRVVREFLPREQFGPDQLLLNDHWSIRSYNEQGSPFPRGRRSTRRHGAATLNP